jgi:crotonobetainyl-CoA:carnitine CoA-transferase CaiB-like acyl-CoA transferase
MPGALAGVRVIDCSSGSAGPRATGMLADYGADVIWVEPPGGDPFRVEMEGPYSAFNRSKRSITIDVRDPTGLDALHKLIGQADVFVESWQPGVAEELGLGYESLHDRLPNLVYCSISGFGQEGPNRDIPGYEAMVHALVGTMGEQPGHRTPPIFEGVPFASIGCGYLAAIGVVAGLVRRLEDGIGRRIETSLLDGALVYLTMLWNDADMPLPPRDPGSNRLIARNFVCADDEIIGVHTGAVGAFGRLMEVVGLDDRIPASETGLDMGIALTPDQRTMLDKSLPEIFGSDVRQVWLDRLTAADVCAIPLLHPHEVFDQPQVIHNEMVVEVDDPVLGTVQQVAPALRFERSKPDLPRPAPQPGAHSGAIEDRSAPDMALDTSDLDRGLLHGLKVVDFGAFYAGPYGSRLLADLGADVIRVETILGDPNRGSEMIFRNSHAGMRSIAVDLKHPEGRKVAAALIKWADVVHHSMRPGAAERMGIAVEDARALKDDIVYVYGPGWGSSGPLAGRQSFAPLMSGYVGASYEAAGHFNLPVYPTGNEDPGNGLLGALAMLLGVFHSRRTGEGEYIEHPQLNAAMTHIAHIVRRIGGAPIGEARLDPLQFGLGPLERLYPTSDGWLCITAVKDREIAALGRVLEVDINADKRFSDPSVRAENADLLERLLGDVFESRSTVEWVDLLRGAGVAAARPVDRHYAAEFLRDPENLRTGRSAECPHPTRRKMREVGVLVRSSHASRVPHRSAPALGEHNEAILEMLGFSAGDIAEMRSNSVISTST